MLEEPRTGVDCEGVACSVCAVHTVHQGMCVWLHP